MSQVIHRIKEGFQYGIGIALAVIAVNLTLGFLYQLFIFGTTLLALKNGMGVAPQ